MGSLSFPAPQTHWTAAGLTVHTWPHAQPSAEPVLLVHGFASSTLYNWVKTGWLDPLAATGRTVVSVDLPGHGESREINPAGLQTHQLLADLHQVTQTAGGRVHLHGYSLGARLCWQFAHRYPEAAASLVLGGPPVSDEVYQIDADQARAWAAEGVQPADEATARFITVAAALPGQHLPHVVELRIALGADRYDPAAEVPEVRTLVVAGTEDSIAEGAEQLTDLVRGAGHEARFVPIPGRNHVNALTARAYKQAVTEFLGR